MLLLPYRIETLFKHWPFANWIIMGLTVAMFLASRGMTEAQVMDLVLGGTSPLGLVGHLLLHGGILHLAGNMLCLWIFGNAVCGMMSQLVYVLLYLGFGVMAAAAHLAFDGAEAIGASGAINGVVGMAFAMFPVNRVSVLWFFVVRGGAVVMPLWGLALIWCAFDAYGALSGEGHVAYCAHLGGFFAGAFAGVVALRFGWITLTEYDNRTLADLLPARNLRPELPKKLSWDDPISLKDPFER